MDAASVPAVCLYCNTEIPPLPKTLRLDLTGDRFTRLHVQHFSHMKNGHAMWCCLCDCGNQVNVLANSLRRIYTKSCGCWRKNLGVTIGKTHGMSGAKIHKRWKTMIERCHLPTHFEYPLYGGRGIAVCTRWRSSFLHFYTDMGDIPPGLTIDRIDNDGPYSPENCQWTTAKRQARNRRNNVCVEHNGAKHCLSEWAELYGIPYATFLERLKRGWSFEKALSTQEDGRKLRWKK